MKCEQQHSRFFDLHGNDVSTLLPTIFGKSLIYQWKSYALVRNILDGRPHIILLKIPLRSIVQEQLRSNEFQLKAVELTLQHEVLKNVREGNV